MKVEIYRLENPVVFGFGAGYVVRIIKVKLHFIEECR